MTGKQKRLTMILGGLAVLGVAAGIILYALSARSPSSTRRAT